MADRDDTRTAPAARGNDKPATSRHGAVVLVAIFICSPVLVLFELSFIILGPVTHSSSADLTCCTGFLQLCVAAELPISHRHYRDRSGPRILAYLIDNIRRAYLHHSLRNLRLHHTRYASTTYCQPDPPVVSFLDFSNVWVRIDDNFPPMPSDCRSHPRFVRISWNSPFRLPIGPLCRSPCLTGITIG